MNSRYFDLPTVGSVSVQRVLARYDGPKIFVGESATGQHFLCYWAGETETGDRWWFIPMSARRESELLSGQRDLRSTLSEAETRSLLEVVWPFSGEAPTEYRYIKTASLLDSDLPDHDSRLNADKAYSAIVAPTLGDEVGESLADKRKRAEKWVNGYTAAAVGSVLVATPIPGAASAILAGLEATMCYQIGKIYRHEWSMGDATAAAGVVGLAGVVGPIAAMEAAILLGPLAFVAKPAIAASIVKTMGQLVIKFFEENAQNA